MSKMARKHPFIKVTIQELAHIKGILCILSCFFLLIFPSLPVYSSAQVEDLDQYYKRYANTPIESVYQQGMDYLKQGETDKALACLTVITSRNYDKMNDQERKIYDYALNNAGAIAQMRSDYLMAFSLFTKALDSADDSVAYRTHNNIAGIYIYYNDYDNARKHLGLAYDIGVRQQDWSSVYNTVHNILDLNWDMDSLRNSMSLIEDFRKLPIAQRDSNYMFISHISNGMESLYKKHYSEAIGHFTRAINAASDLPFKENYEVPSYMYIAKAYMEMGDYSAALSNLRICEKKSLEGEALDMLITTYRYMYLCHVRSGDLSAAHAAKYRYMELKDSINNANEYGKIKDMEFFYESNKYEKQVQQLTSEKKVRGTISWAIGLGLLLTLSFLALTIFQNKKLSENNKDLFKKNVALIKYQEHVERLELEKTKEEDNSKMPEGERYKSSCLTVEGKEMLLARIRRVMHSPSEFCQDDFTIDKLAMLVNSNTKYVSQVINEKLGKNFNTLLNEQRINEVCKRLVDTANNGNKTNDAIAEEVGFKSRSHFIRTFKKITGLTPTQYQRMAKEEGMASSNMNAAQ